MVKQVSSLTWLPVSDDNNSWAAGVAVDSSVDTIWQITVPSTAPNTNSANVIKPKYMIVDNVANNALVSVAFGPYVFNVTQYARKTFILPSNTRSVTVAATVGTVQLYFTNSPAPDEINQVAIITAGNANVIYTPVFYNTTVTAAPTDNNKNIIFSPGSDMLYNLRGIAATPISAGWIAFVSNRSAANYVTITPNGADVINAGASIKIGPGDSGYIYCDGATWYYVGNCSLVSPEIVSNSNALLTTLTHGFGKIPNQIELWMRCKTIDLGYAVGDEIFYGITGHTTVGGNAVGHSIIASATQILFRTSNNTTAGYFSYAHKTTGAETGMVQANWRYFIKAAAWW